MSVGEYSTNSECEAQKMLKLWQIVTISFLKFGQKLSAFESTKVMVMSKSIAAR